MLADVPSTFRSFSLFSFIGDRRGNVAMIFGISAAMMFGAVGSAVDFGRWVTVSQEMQAALDSAVLAAARTLQVTGDATASIKVGEQYFDQMSSTWVEAGSTRTFTTASNDTIVNGTVKAKISTPFLSMIGVADISIPLKAQAVISAGQNSGTNLEISMMLDITGSMGGQKIIDLKAAAKDLIDIVIWEDQSTYTSKIALAPFAAYVNVGSTYINNVTGLPA